MKDKYIKKIVSVILVIVLTMTNTSYIVHSEEVSTTTTTVEKQESSPEENKQSNNSTTQDNVNTQVNVSNNELNSVGEGMLSSTERSISKVDDLINLSIMPAQDYQYDTIIFTGGNITVESTKNFLGLGSEEYPFAGKIKSNANTGFAFNLANKSLFNYLSTTAILDCPGGFVMWSNSGDKPLLAANLVDLDQDNATVGTGWNIDVYYGEQDTGTIYNTNGGLIGSVTSTRQFNIGLSLIEQKIDGGSPFAYTSTATKLDDSSDSIGLFCNTLENGANLYIASLSLNSSLFTNTLKISASNAGLLVGNMKNGSSLNLPNGFNIKNGANETNTEGNDYLITISGTENSGGIAGVATNANISLGEEKILELDSHLTLNGKNVGGIFGNYSISDDKEFDASNISINDIKLATIDGCSNYGGMFGILNIEESKTFTLKQLNVSSQLTGSSELSNYGGIAGTVLSTTAPVSLTSLFTANNTLASIVISGTTEKKGTITSSWSGGRKLNFGGVVAQLGNGTTGVYLNVSNVSSTRKDGTVETNYFGGLVSQVKNYSVLDVSDFEVIANDVSRGGGIAGEIFDGAIIQISKKTVFNKLSFSSSVNVGQLVAKQGNSLIYAKKDWEYIRCNSKRVDDIGNYGQVIRLGGNLSEDLFSINANHELVVNGLVDDWSSDVTIDSTDTFAKFAVSLQSNGVFCGLNANVTTVNITKDINLSDTGIMGLLRDDGFNSFKNSITIIGKKNDNTAPTITLGIGKTYGLRGNSGKSDSASGAGSGQIYGHQYLGLIANGETDISISNLIINGSVNFGVDVDGINVGSFIANSSGTNSFENCQTNMTIDFDGSSDTYNAYIGGFVGKATSNITFTGCKANNNIINNIANNNIRIGGLIANSSGDDKTIKTIEVTSTEISTSIKNEKSVTNARYGGLIAEMQNKQTLDLSGITLSPTMDIKASASSGGLMGYKWDNTDLNLTGDVTVSDASLTVTGNASIGGMVYSARGHWLIGNTGKLTISSSTISSIDSLADSAMGILICHGEPTATTSGNALYLEIRGIDTYVIDKSTTISKKNNTNFDELVVYTARGESKEVVVDGTSGQSIISIDTRDKDLYIDNNNSYQNQTSNNGFPWSYNPYSRYYYNIYNEKDKIIDSDSKISTPQELYLWSIHKYAHSSIKNNFDFGDVNCTTLSGDLIMSGLSYYPIDIGSIHIVKGTTILFNNNKIEEYENEKRNTSGDNTNHTQHYMMHGGLFRNVSGVIDVIDSSTTALNSVGNYSSKFKTILSEAILSSVLPQIHNTTLVSTSSLADTGSSSSITFTGSIGKYNGGSGFLISGAVTGGNETTKQNIKLSDIQLSDAYVNNCGTDYAPLLINTVGSNVNLDIKSLYSASSNEGTYQSKQSNSDEWYAGSSLIGNVGDPTNGTGINLNFSDIRLDARMSKGSVIESYGTFRTIFSHASFMEQFCYIANSSGTYNFNENEDWLNGSPVHNVTYGKEISTSIRNPQLQYEYYNTTNFVNPDENPSPPTNNESNSAFENGYLPYINISNVKENVPEGKADYYNEIDVNLKRFNLDEGCGTYGHPYKITSAGQLETVASILSTGSIPEGWTVCYNEISAGGDYAYCNGSENDEIYKYTAEKWYNDEGSIVADDIQESAIISFLQRAYYKINNDISFSSSFQGLGTDTYVFHGVIVGSSSDMPTISLSGNSGLINYSDGSVVKDIRITTKNPISLGQDDNKVTISYGSVINLITGGDNIIDNVSIENIRLSTFSGDYKQLIAVGGYVGMVKSGGLVLRNMKEKSGLNVTDQEDNYFYINPFVGRVLDAYVISEDDVVDNTDKNYKIPTFNSDNSEDVDSLTVNSNSIDINNAEGMYLLSAIVNSGAGSYSSSDFTVDSYKASKSIKKRTANYDSIGNPTKLNDYTQANNDDKGAASQDPYLIKKYVDDKGNANKITQTSMSINITNNCDLSGYGNGFRGIGTRFNSTNTQLNLSNGPHDFNTKIIKVDMKVKQYDDDNYPQYELGIFNELRMNNSVSKIEIKNAIISGNIQYTQYSSTGEPKELQLNQKTDKSDGYVFVGGLIAKLNGNSKTLNINSIQLNNLKLQGGHYAGGLIAYATSSTITINDSFFASNSTGDGVSFENAILGIQTGYVAGGLIGYSTSELKITTEKDLEYSNAYIESTNQRISNTNIVNYASIGALIGLSSQKVTINNSKYFISIRNVKVLRSQSSPNANTVYTGGVVGYIETTTTSDINNVKVYDAEIGDYGEVQFIGSTTASSSQSCAGGIVGGVVNGTINLTNCNFESGTIISGNLSTGMIGYLKNCKPNIASCSVATFSECYIWGYNRSAAAIGYYDAKSLTISNFKIGKRIEDNKEEEGKLLLYVSKTVDNSSGVSVKKSWSESTFAPGGLVACVSNVDAKISFKDCAIYNMTIVGPTQVGGIIGDARKGNIIFENVSVIDSKVICTTLDDNYFYNAGGLIGHMNNASGVVKGYNILQSNNIIGKMDDTGDWTDWISKSISSDSLKQDANYVGTWIGSNLGTTYLAGVEAKNANNTSIKDVGSSNLKLYSYPSNSFIAYGDYTSSALNDELQGGGAAPYVTTSPKSDVSLGDISLYGDGAGLTSGDTGIGIPILTKIYDEALETGGYNDATLVATKTSLGTFVNSNHMVKYSETSTPITNDFAVLLLEANKQDDVTAIIKGYMNLLTNGGFSRATNNLGTSASYDSTNTMYSIDIKTYKYMDNTFQRDSTTSLKFENDDSGNYLYKVNGNDFQENKITVVTASFKVKDLKDFNDNEVLYKVQLPVVVKKPVKIEFKASVLNDTQFLDSSFNSTSTQVLTDYGSRFTVKLDYDYTYDWNLTALQNRTDFYYDKSINLYKTITNSTILPSGTIIKIIDCQNGDVMAQSSPLNQNTSQLKFSELFPDVTWSTMTQMMIAKKDSEGDWVQDDNGTIEIQGTKYRVKNDSDSGDFYTLQGNNGDTKIHESYILVIETPTSDTANACNIAFNSVNRLDGMNVIANDVTNNHSDGYRGNECFICQSITQNLTKGGETASNSITNGESYELQSTSTTINLKLVDTISRKSEYANEMSDSDERYLDYELGLRNQLNGVVAYQGEIYVNVNFKAGDKELASYTRSIPAGSSATSISLPLSEDGTKNSNKLINIAKNIKNQDNLQIVADLTIEFRDGSLAMDVFPLCSEFNETSNEPNTYVKFKPTATLSESSLLVSGSRVNISQEMKKYYKSVNVNAVLSYNPDRLADLGINPLSPDEKPINESDTAIINSTGIIEASQLVDGDNRIIDNTSYMTCTLTLWSKNNNNTYVKEEDMSKYIKSINDESLPNEIKDYSWKTVKNDEEFNDYYDNKVKRFTIPIKLEVFKDIETSSRLGKYANYRVQLEVHFFDKDGKQLDSLKSDYFVYTLAKISTEILRKQNNN